MMIMAMATMMITINVFINVYDESMNKTNPTLKSPEPKYLNASFFV